MTKSLFADVEFVRSSEIQERSRMERVAAECGCNYYPRKNKLPKDKG
jgi:hypothetical protein